MTIAKKDLDGVIYESKVYLNKLFWNKNNF